MFLERLLGLSLALADGQLDVSSYINMSNSEHYSVSRRDLPASVSDLGLHTSFLGLEINSVL